MRNSNNKPTQRKKRRERERENEIRNKTLVGKCNECLNCNHKISYSWRERERERGFVCVVDFIPFCKLFELKEYRHNVTLIFQAWVILKKKKTHQEFQISNEMKQNYNFNVKEEEEKTEKNCENWRQLKVFRPITLLFIHPFIFISSFGTQHLDFASIQTVLKIYFWRNRITNIQIFFFILLEGNKFNTARYKNEREKQTDRII